MELNYRPNAKELQSLLSARNRAFELLYETVDFIKPGMTEEVARKQVLAHFKNAGIDKHWHAPKIRFGSETLKTFSDPADQSVVLKEEDIFFLDYGPALDGFEADVGDTFVIGKNPKHLHLQQAAREIFEIVKKYWQETQKQGTDLYAYAAQVAEKYDVIFEPHKAGGHIISEFPHKLKYQGLSKVALHTYESQVVEGVWVLEIQLAAKDGSCGAFYEDLLIRL